MNADRVLALFEQISEAPDAIPRLRRFILDLAVRGKLVEQDPEELSESSYRSLITFSSACEWMPETWLYVPLASLLRESSRNGYSRKPDDAEDGTPILRISAGTARMDGLVAEEEFKLISGIDESLMDQYELIPGDLLACRFNGNKSYVGRLSLFTGYLGRRFIYPDKLIRIRLAQELADPAFLRWISASDFLRSEIESKCATTVGNWGISAGKLKTCFIPLPPLAEQHRIVAKVDELMALCDQLEAARMQREQCRERLVAASLQRLNQPSDEPDTFRSDARFALQVLPGLTTTPAQIKQLRQTILNLAVRGKLVEQDPEDEPAIITITGALLAAADTPRKKSRRKASWTPPTENENQELPTGWHLFNLAELVDPASPLSYGVLVPGDDVPDGIPFVRAQDLMLKDHPALPGKKIAQEIDSKYGRTRLTGGEILICVVGSIGKIGIAPEHWSGANIARAVARLKLIPEVSATYMLLALQSEMLQGFFKDSTRTLAQPTLNISLIEVAPIPLPPLAEQHRIVAKVDALMALCDQLEQQLSQAEQSRRGLLEAVLREVLAGRLPERPEESHAAIA